MSMAGRRPMMSTSRFGSSLSDVAVAVAGKTALHTRPRFKTADF